MVDMRLLRAATTVADERNITRAADRLGLTQPALSKQITELEHSVGYALFERNRKRFLVTAAGAAFVEHSRTALSEIERAVQSGREAWYGADDVVCVAKSPYVDPYLTSIMGTLRLPLYPNFRLRFSSHFSTVALRMLRSGEADVALTRGLYEVKGFTSVKLTEEPIFVAFPSSDPLYEKRALQLADLRNGRCALFERTINPQIYDKFRRLLEENKIPMTEIQHIKLAEEAAALIMQRGCLALLTQSGAWRIMNDQIAIRPLQEEQLMLKTYLSARLDEQSKLVGDFTRGLMRRLTTNNTRTEPLLDRRVLGGRVVSLA